MKKHIKKLAKRAGFIFWKRESWAPSPKTIDWSSMYDDALVKFYKLAKAEAKAELKDNNQLVDAVGAIYDFAGFLTTRDRVLVCSKYHNSASMAESISEFLNLRNVPASVTPNIAGWQDINEEIRPHKKSPLKDDSAAMVKFFRYVRPIDPRTGLFNSQKGVCFYIVMDYNDRTVGVSSSVCNGDNFNKDVAKTTALFRFNHTNDNFYFSLDDFINSGLSIVGYIESYLPVIDYPASQAIIKQIKMS